MLILPIVNRNRILNVHVTLKNAEKVRRGVNFSDAKESEVIVNGKKLSESIYNNYNGKVNALSFIRYNTMHYPRNFLITTKVARDSKYYDVYEVAPPPKKVSDELDNLYEKVLTDMRKEIPGTNNGRYLSFKEVGIDKNLTKEKIDRLQSIVRNEPDNSKWPKLFSEAGIADLQDTLDFIKNFECTVVSETTIPEKSLNDTLKALEVIHTRDSKHLRKYSNIAYSNEKIYYRLSYINKIITNQPLNLIQSEKQKQKRLIKQEVLSNVQAS